MPTIFDNDENRLIDELSAALAEAHCAEFCVGYLNLRGWRLLDEPIRQWPGGCGAQCRVLVGMQRPDRELVAALCGPSSANISNEVAERYRRELAAQLKEQLIIGRPTDADEAGLRRLAAELHTHQVAVKLFLSYPLHAKLYLLHRQDNFTPLLAYLGSSNLTFAGLQGQGELDIDVVEQDAADKLSDWFEKHWDDHWCIDISKDLETIINESWAREEPIPPYHIYLDMAYHLSEEARAGAVQFRVPKRFGDTLLDFQVKAVQLAARHLNQRNGVLIGDVVGLGKTLMATAVAAVFEEDSGDNTLVICPKNLVDMWQGYLDTWKLRGRVLSISQVQKELPSLSGFRLLILDESQNLRNPEGKRYKVIRQYIQQHHCRCLLLSATPYNKSYLDLAGQLGLFLDDDASLPVAPEAYLREQHLSHDEFVGRFQCPTHTLAAFKKSESADDWRTLMSLYMVRRTRSYIRKTYAQRDEARGQYYLQMSGGDRFYLPDRVPHSETFAVNPNDPQDQYAALYSDEVVAVINDLHLPRYGLQAYVDPKHAEATPEQQRIIDDLTRAGRRLMGFCRTNLFKRLESSGQSFLLSIERHVLRNEVFLYALEHDLPLPIGTQGAELLQSGVTLDTRFEDEDADAIGYTAEDLLDDASERRASEQAVKGTRDDAADEGQLAERAKRIYETYVGPQRKHFRWLPASFFSAELAQHLREDAERLVAILRRSSPWRPEEDHKLETLQRLLCETYPHDKVLVFSQFADTVDYVADQLKERGLQAVAGVTGVSAKPTELARRFSPRSNNAERDVSPQDELRCLIATDVLSEGQNLQDAHIVVNYDLPWAIVRLIQRAGRVDRIGQDARQIECHSFWPVEGVEQLLRLRSRLRTRLHENKEVVGSDEQYFEDEPDEQRFVDLYTEESGILDDPEEGDVDLVSEADGIWRRAIAADPSLEAKVKGLPPVVYSTKAWTPSEDKPEGALVYVQTADGNAALGWVRPDGTLHSASTLAVLRAAECAPDTPALERQCWHHEAVAAASAELARVAYALGGSLGGSRSVRFKTYERLSSYATKQRGTPFSRTEEAIELDRIIEQIYAYPLLSKAEDTLSRQLAAKQRDEDLIELVRSLYRDGALCQVPQDGEAKREPVIICSLGLAAGEQGG